MIVVGTFLFGGEMVDSHCQKNVTVVHFVAKCHAVKSLHKSYLNRYATLSIITQVS